MIRMGTACRYCEEEGNEVSEVPTICKACDEAFMNAMREYAEDHAPKIRKKVNQVKPEEWPDILLDI